MFSFQEGKHLVDHHVGRRERAIDMSFGYSNKHIILTQEVQGMCTLVIEALTNIFRVSICIHTP